MSDLGQQTTAMLLDWIDRGPTLLVANPDAVGCSNLPDFAKSKALVIELAGDQGREILNNSNAQGFNLPYGHPDGSNGIAHISWESLFVVVGSDKPGQRTVKTQPAATPDFLGQDKLMAVRWVMRALGLGDLPQSPNEWNISITPQTMAMDGDRSAFEPDHRRALTRCMEANPPMAILLVDGRHKGVDIPEQWPRIDGQTIQIPIVRAPPTERIEADDDGVSWTTGIRNGQQDLGKFDFYVPWSAIGALRHPTDFGWFWPDQLPQRFREALLSNPDVFDNRERLRGAPLAQPTEVPEEPPPLVVLPVPHRVDKPTALADCKARRGGLVLIDTRVAGVELPVGLRGAALLALPFGAPEIAADVEAQEAGILAQLPDFKGNPVEILAPWPAVILVATNEGGARVYAWPEDYPAEIEEGLRVLHDMWRNGGEPSQSLDKLHFVVPAGSALPDGQGSQISLGRNQQGEYMMLLQQPCGIHPENGEQLNMEVQFCLPLATMH